MSTWFFRWKVLEYFFPWWLFCYLECVKVMNFEDNHPSISVKNEKLVFLSSKWNWTEASDARKQRIFLVKVNFSLSIANKITGYTANRKTCRGRDLITAKAVCGLKNSQPPRALVSVVKGLFESMRWECVSGVILGQRCKKQTLNIMPRCYSVKYWLLHAWVGKSPLENEQCIIELSSECRYITGTIYRAVYW